MFSYHICHIYIFIGLGRAYSLGGDFEVIIWEEMQKRMAPLLWGKLTPQDTM